MSRRILEDCQDRQDLCVLAMTRGADRYVVIYDDQHHGEVVETFGRWASHPELNFTWYDAACLAHRLKARA